MVAGKKGEKTLTLGARLKYPIKITKLYKNPGDAIRKQEPVLQYSFEYTMELPNDRETLELQTKTLTSITDWYAPEDGKLLSWRLRVGDTITRDQPCVVVEEACTHEIQYQGLCALCGKDMNEVNWANEHRDTERAPINMTHDQTNLTVSKVAATRAEHELQSRLLAQRKLSLVVDLDQTIIHACIDPTIGEWQEDPSNPNYGALKDVCRFQLDEGYHGLARGCWYYIKMRPGLQRFLANIAALYELHVYTMGTRTYATNIAHIVDPEQKIFGNRVISRDENGNIVAKSLQRLFPVSTNMAVIMDDRADVWPYNRRNLIKVSPFDFFKGTGDINSSFLPKREDLPTSTSSPSPSPDPVVTNPSNAVVAASANINQEASSPSEMSDGSDSSDTGSSAVPSVFSPASTEVGSTVTSPGTSIGGDNSPGLSPLKVEGSSTTPASVPVPVSTSTSTSTSTSAPSASTATAASTASTATPTAIAANGTPRLPAASDEDSVDDPVLMQKQAEEQERTIEQQIKERPLLHMQEQLDKEDETMEEANLPDRTRHCVLFDDDNELAFLEKHLTTLHHQFYEEYDARTGSNSAGNKNGKSLSDLDVVAVPDVGDILVDLKKQVLQNTTIVLSGLVPLGMPVEQSEIGLQALSFGARLQKHISKKVTHLVISSDRPRTQKVRQAARIPSIKIVNQHWLAACFSQWQQVDEAPYTIALNPLDRERALAKPQSEVSDADSSDVDSDQENGNRRVKFVISTSSGRKTPTNGDEFEEFNNSDPVSPIAELGTFDWGSADDELEMFLAEEDDDDDDDDEDGEDGTNDEGDTDNDASSKAVSKRKLGEDTDTDSDQGSTRGRTLTIKRQKLGQSRSRSSSKLRTAESATASKAAPTTSVTSAPKEETKSQAPTKTAPAETKPVPASVEIDEDQLEAMLMAELDEEELDQGASGCGYD